MSIVRINHFRAADGQGAALREFLWNVVDKLREAAGCSACQLLAEPEQPAHFVILETWDSIAAHRAAASLIPPEMLAAIRPLLGAPPEGTYYEALR